MAKPCTCDTRRGLCVRCCGVVSSQVRRPGAAVKNRVLVEVAWDGLSVEGESPVDENIVALLSQCPRVAAGPWNLL